jgi:hypothetical protein
VSTLWTPSGEHEVPRPSAGETGNPDSGPGGGGAGRRAPAARPRAEASPSTADDLERGDELTPEELAEAQAEMDAVREQLLRAPVELVISNHAMGLWELAALHLSQKPPQLPQAQLAIDALSAIVEGLQGRLGEAERTLAEGLAEIRMAFVQIANAERARRGAEGGS